MMLERICFSVLESSLVASVLYALMMLGEGRLAKYSPRCRSTLWFILSARLLVPLPVGIVYFGDSFAQAKWQLLGRVWLAGMAAFFALHLLAYYRLSRRLSRGERHLSLSHAEQQEIRRVFYEIKSTLKIAAQTLLDTARFLLERQRRHQMLLASCLSSSAQRLKKRLIALFLPVGLNGRPLVLFAAVLMMLGIYIA